VRDERTDEFIYLLGLGLDDVPRFDTICEVCYIMLEVRVDDAHQNFVCEIESVGLLSWN
jgi:hypothetical protein